MSCLHIDRPRKRRRLNKGVKFAVFAALVVFPLEINPKELGYSVQTQAFEGWLIEEATLRPHQLVNRIPFRQCPCIRMTLAPMR